MWGKMKQNKKDQQYYKTLRARAEKVLIPDLDRNYSQVEIRELVHEMQTHQIELELQNEELQRSQVDLSDSLDQYAMLYDFAPIGYVTLDQKGSIKIINLKLSRWLGVDRVDLLKSKFHSFVHGESQSDFIQYIKDVNKTKSHQSCEVLLLDAKGSPFWVELVADHLQTDEDGEPDLNIVITHIDARRQAEAEKVRTAERLKNLMSHTSAGYFCIDKDGCFKDVNNGWLKMHGYDSTEEIIGQHYSLTQTEEDVKKADLAVEHIFSSEVGETDHFSRRNKDGSTGYHMYSIIPVLEKGAIAGIEGFLIDITKIIEAEDRLKISEARYRDLFDNMNEGFALHEIIRDKTGKAIDYTFLEVNAAHEELTGLSRDELLGKKISEALPDVLKDSTDWVSIYAGVVESGETYTFERYSEALGKWFSTKAFKTDEDKFATVVEDVSERVKVKQAINTSRDQLRLLSQRLISVREDERTILARELHDGLGQVLTAINFDLDSISALLTEDQEKIARKIERMMNLLTNSIGDVQRLSGKLRPKLLDELGLDDAILWYANEFSARTSIEIKYVNKMKIRKIDPARSIALFRIMQEALTNVARHAEATKVLIVLSDVSDGVSMTIADNGVGIQLADKGRIDAIGLVGMKERTLPFGGTFSIEAGKSYGTRVTVVLPDIQE